MRVLGLFGNISGIVTVNIFIGRIQMFWSVSNLSLLLVLILYLLFVLTGGTPSLYFLHTVLTQKLHLLVTNCLSFTLRTVYFPLHILLLWIFKSDMVIAFVCDFFF